MATTTKLQEAPSPSSRWSTKHYILLALAGTLVVTVIVIAISAVFSPTEINFSVTKATHAESSDGGMQLNLTVAAANPGWRAGVEYRSLSVDLLYTPKNDVPKEVNAYKLQTVSTPFVQLPRNTTTFLVQFFLAAGYWSDNLKGETNSTKISVQVTASVRFMIGKAYTRLYDIVVSCDLGLALFDRATVLFDDGTANCFAVGSDE